MLLLESDMFSSCRKQSSDLTALENCWSSHIGYHGFILYLLNRLKKKKNKAVVKVNKAVYLAPKHMQVS